MNIQLSIQNQAIALSNQVYAAQNDWGISFRCLLAQPNTLHIDHHTYPLWEIDKYPNTVGFISEAPAVIENFTVKENLQLYAKANHKIISSEKYQEIFDLFSSLKKCQHQPVSSLSGGERQMLNLAKMLFMDEAIIFLVDTPTQGLSPALREKVSELFQKISTTATIIVP